MITLPQWLTIQCCLHIFTACSALVYTAILLCGDDPQTEEDSFDRKFMIILLPIFALITIPLAIIGLIGVLRLHLGCLRFLMWLSCLGFLNCLGMMRQGAPAHLILMRFTWTLSSVLFLNFLIDDIKEANRLNWLIHQWFEGQSQ